MTAALYGAPPRGFDPPMWPTPEPVRPIVTPFTVSPLTPSPLTPCAKCARHIHAGTECPFCHADAVARPVDRQALEEADKALTAAEQSLAAARDHAIEARERICSARERVRKALGR